MFVGVGAMRNRHRILLAGIAALILGSIAASVTISRIYWYSPIYFYRYTGHPLMGLGIILCTLGGLLVLFYVVIRLWEYWKAKKEAQAKPPVPEPEPQPEEETPTDQAEWSDQ